MADSVTFAIIRRISRESVYTARLIDLAARFLNSVLSSHLPQGTEVHVSPICRLDRPTIKVLARAMLLLTPHHGFAWVWHSHVDPTVETQSHSEDLFIRSRLRLLRQLVGILLPTFEKICSSDLSPPDRGSPRPLGDLSVALVVQNYDACFLWSDASIEGGSPDEVVDGLRIKALAAVNIGETAEALKALETAEALAATAGRRAHLAYLQGLIEAKRGYDLARSRLHYERGLQAIDSGKVAEFEDISLERAWLLNGIALNEAIAWRKNAKSSDHFDRAFRLLQESFTLVRDGKVPARIYLRSNLLANSALLLEMRGEYEAAIDLFQKAFDRTDEPSQLDADRWVTTLGYRLGVLHYRAGRGDVALHLLRTAAAGVDSLENESLQERILRAVGVVSLGLGDWSNCLEAFSTGLHMVRASRSAEGTREHGRGMVASLCRSGDHEKARETVQTLRKEESLTFPETQAERDGSFDRVAPSAPAPKLPAYIPEIDLEGIPPIDLNRFLANSPVVSSPGPHPWKE